MNHKLVLAFFATAYISASVTAYVVFKVEQKYTNERFDDFEKMHTKVVHRLAAYAPVEVLHDALTEIEFDEIVQDLKDN